MVKGSSFSLDTKEPRKTRVHGNGLLIDLDVLEIEMGGGILRYSPTHVEFEKGLARWISMMNEEKFSLHFNEKLVLQLYSPDETPYFQLSMPQGNGVFRDLLLDKSLSQKISLQLCILESILDPSLTVESCQSREADSHPTISSQLEALALSMVLISEKVIGTEESMTEGILSSVWDLFIDPLSSNFSVLSVNLSDGLQSLDAKILQSSQEMATRTLNSFRNLSATLGANITALRDSLAELGLLQEAALGTVRSDLVAEFGAADARLAEKTWENISSLNSTLTQTSSEQQNRLASQLTSQLLVLNSSLSSQWTAAAARLNSSEEALAGLAAHLNLTFQSVENQFATRLATASEELLFSVTLLNSSLQQSLFVSENWTHSQLEELRLSLQGGLSSAKADLSEKTQELEASLGEVFSYFNSSIGALNASLQLSDQQLSGLSSNTSQAIARSNAILTRVIAEVNISLTEYKNASMASFEAMFESFTHSLQSVQAALRGEFRLLIDEARQELGNETLGLGAEVRRLNSSLQEDISRLKSDANSSASAFTGALGGLRSEVDENQRSMESQLHTTNASLASQISDLSTSLSSLLNSTTQQVKQELDLQASSVSARFHGLLQESSGSLQEIRTVLSEMGQLLYPSLGSSLWSPSGGPQITDLEWYPSIRNSSQRAPVVFHLIDEKITSLGAETLKNVTNLRSETEAQGATLQGLLNSTEANLLSVVNESSALLRELISSLNQSFVAQRDSSALSTLNLELLISESAENLTALVRAASLQSEGGLSSLEAAVNDTFAHWRHNFSEALAELRNQTAAENTRLLTMATLLNHSMQLGDAALSSAVANSSAELAVNVSKLSLATQSNISAVQETLAGALEATKDLILNQTLRPWQRSLDSQHNATQSQIARLNASTASAVSLLAENTTGALRLLFQNFSAEAEALSRAIAQTNRSGVDGLRSLGSNMTSELSGVNHSLSQLDSRLVLLASNFSNHERSQATLWLQVATNISGLAFTARSLVSDLNLTVAEVNRSLVGAVASSGTLLAAEWNRSLVALNHSLAASVTNALGTATSLVGNLNSSLSSALQTSAQDLRAKLSLLENHVNQSQRELRVLLEEKDGQIRVALSTEVNLTRQEASAAVSLANRTLRLEMAALSSEVNRTLRSSLENTSQLLTLQTLAQDGKAALLSHRVGALENVSVELQASSSSSALQGELLKAEVKQLTDSLGATRGEQQLLVKALRDVELSVGNATSLLASSQSQLTSLRADHGSLQNQFTSLLMNSSANAAALAQIFASVNGSQELMRLALEESRSRSFRLEKDIEAGRLRVEATEGEVRNISQLALPRALSRIEEVGSAAAKERGRLEERIEREEAKSTGLVAADETLGKKVAALELETKSIKDAELGALRKGLEESKSRCDLLTGEVRKEVSRSQEENEAQEKKLRELGEKVAVLETKASYQDKRIAELVEENEKMRRNLASQSSVDDLRKLIQDLQSSMLSHSNKVLDVVITKLASSKDNN